MKAQLVTIKFLMPDHPGAAGTVTGNIANIRERMGLYDYIVAGDESVEIEDLRGHECDWEDWKIRGRLVY